VKSVTWVRIPTNGTKVVQAFLFMAEKIRIRVDLIRSGLGFGAKARILLTLLIQPLDKILAQESPSLTFTRISERLLGGVILKVNAHFFALWILKVLTYCHRVSKTSCRCGLFREMERSCSILELT